jgi:UDP-N-acetylmuramoyl-tripeptide--D-alanyl-D-alanine ligase
MIHMTLRQAAETLGVNAPNTTAEFDGISIDSRTIKPGNLFIAIRGERVDGHDYVETARQQGAVAAIVSHAVDCALPQIIVKDTTDALGQLGTKWRSQFTLPVIAVTGSNGKTTLKNMIASIMVAACNNNENEVLATQGTLNNHWGLPLTLSRLNKNHKFAAIEMGMNHFGEINYLTSLTQPNVAVITNAGASHLEGLGDVAGVARAKGEIFSGLQKNGVAILNRDDAFFTFWHSLIGDHHFITFGFHPTANVTATINHSEQVQSITLQTPEGNIDIDLPLLGKHNVHNALAAAAATLAVGISLKDIKAGLEQIKPAPGRLQLHTLSNGVKVIDDTYNANPFSLQAAINILSTFAGKKILVLGDMKELGNEAASLHQEAGKNIRQAGIDYLFTYGDMSADCAHSFGQGAYHFSDQHKLVEALKPFLHNTTTILVKGSRSMRMEKVVAELVN